MRCIKWDQVVILLLKKITRNGIVNIKELIKRQNVKKFNAEIRIMREKKMKKRKLTKILAMTLSVTSLFLLCPAATMVDAKDEGIEVVSFLDNEAIEEENTEYEIAGQIVVDDIKANAKITPFSVGDVFRTNIMIGGNPVLCAFTILSEGSGNNTVEIGWAGGGGVPGAGSVAVSSSAAVGDLVIPVTIVNPVNGQTYDVVGIGDLAFQNCNLLTSTGLDTNSTVTYVGKQAFMYCDALTETGLATNTTVHTLRDEAFEICALLTDTGLDVNTTVRNIGKWAFSNCYSLTDTGLATNTTLTSVPEYAFGGCSGLTSTGLASNTTITHIGTGAFLSCPSLTGTGLENNSTVTSIGKEAFWNCAGLLTTGLENPLSGVTLVDDKAFKACPMLVTTGFSTNLSVTTLGAEAFSHCTGLTSTGLATNTTLTALSLGTFWTCTSLNATGIETNTTLVDVSESAFQDCAGLLSSGLESNTTVTSIGDDAFLRCGALTGDLVLGKQVGLVGVRAFKDSGYDRIYLLQDTSAAIGADAFLFTGGVGTLYVPDTWTGGSNPTLGSNTYDATLGSLVYMYTPKVTNVLAARTSASAATVDFDIDIPGEFKSNDPTLGWSTPINLISGSHNISYINIGSGAQNISYEASTYYGTAQTWYNTATLKGAFPIGAWGSSGGSSGGGNGGGNNSNNGNNNGESNTENGEENNSGNSTDDNTDNEVNNNGENTIDNVENNSSRGNSDNDKNTSNNDKRGNPKPERNNRNYAPKTGDMNNFGLWIAFMLSSGLGLVGVLVCKNRQKRI